MGTGMLLNRAWAFLVMLGCCLASPPGQAAEAVKSVPFVFTDLDGRTVRLTDYRGKWVLVNIWAPWCPLCKLLVPTLNSLNQRPDLRVIGIALDYGMDEDAIRRSMQLTRMRFDAVVAGGARRDANAAFRQVGPVDYFPTSYLYDPQGEIVMFLPGQLRANKVTNFMASWQEKAAARVAEAGKAPAAVPVLAARTELLAAALRQRHGESGGRAFADWKAMMDAASGLPEARQVERVNDYFNRRIQIQEDQKVWGRPDYWASPGELLGAGRGDSEDFAIAKYFSLLALGVPADRLRLVYTQSEREAVHMVLAWYENPGRDPLILDSHHGALVPAARRPDLRPVYSFNSQGVWDETAAAASAGSPRRLAVWEDTLRRARGEGFE